MWEKGTRQAPPTFVAWQGVVGVENRQGANPFLTPHPLSPSLLGALPSLTFLPSPPASPPPPHLSLPSRPPPLPVSLCSMQGSEQLECLYNLFLGYRAPGLMQTRCFVLGGQDGGAGAWLSPSWKACDAAWASAD